MQDGNESCHAGGRQQNLQDLLRSILMWHEAGEGWGVVTVMQRIWGVWLNGASCFQNFHALHQGIKYNKSLALGHSREAAQVSPLSSMVRFDISREYKRCQSVSEDRNCRAQGLINFQYPESFRGWTSINCVITFSIYDASTTLHRVSAHYAEPGCYQSLCETVFGIRYGKYQILQWIRLLTCLAGAPEYRSLAVGWFCNSRGLISKSCAANRRNLGEGWLWPLQLCRQLAENRLS